MPNIVPLAPAGAASTPRLDRARLMDVLRGLLASWIVLHHAVLSGGFDPNLYPWRLLAHHGQEAVLVFFLLSGFAIAMSLAGRRQRWTSFLIVRFWRIYPVYLVALAIGLGICWYAEARGPDLVADLGRLRVETWSPDEGSPNWLHVGLHVLQLHGVVPAAWLPHADISLVAPGWSLSTEFQFYALAPLLLPLLSIRRAGAGIAVGFLVISAGLLGYVVSSPAIAPANVLRHLDLFVLGMLAARWRRSRLMVRVGYSLLAIAVALVGWRNGHVIVANAIGVWLAFWWAASLPTVDRLLDSPVGRLGLFVGALSFPLYIIHYPVARLMLISIGSLSPMSRASFLTVWLPATIALSYAGAWLLHVRAEIPGTRHGKQIAERRDKGHANRAGHSALSAVM
jgi:peptidoglycan/LPS O-acetylase OafA/YrhL